MTRLVLALMMALFALPATTSTEEEAQLKGSGVLTGISEHGKLERS